MIDGEPPAQRVQAVWHPGEPGLCQCQRVDHPVLAQRWQAGAAEFHVQEAEIEWRVMRDQRAVGEELRQWLSDRAMFAASNPGRDAAMRLEMLSLDGASMKLLASVRGAVRV